MLSLKQWSKRFNRIGISIIVFLIISSTEASSASVNDEQALHAYELGIQYGAKGEILNSEDSYLALFWLRQAAARDFLPAVHAIGWYLYKGLGGIAELEKAYAHFQTAANAGYAESQYMLGIMYGQGWGVEKDSIVSLQWMKRAAEQGHANANLVLKGLIGTTSISGLAPRKR